MHVAIVGYGAVEGPSMLEYWRKRGAQITVCEQNPDVALPPGTMWQVGPNYLNNIGSFDVIMRNPAVPPKAILAKNPQIAGKITTQINEFLRVSPTKNIIGITGTKGKGTTSTLISKMLEAAGKKVYLAGNIGRSPFDFLEELHPDDWVVLELSSFQLADVTHAPHIALCLMMAPEHLDWHDDAEDYYSAKARLFSHQAPDDIAIYFADNTISHRIASASPGRKIAYYDEPGAYVFEDKLMIDQTVLCKTGDLKLLGKHNWQNACAAATVFWQVEQNPEAIRKVLTTFTGLEHRLELVRELDNVKYYNDSFGTTPETAIVAVQAFAQPKIVILGGSDKGASFDKLAQAVVDNNVRQVITIGLMGPKIAEALRAHGFTDITAGGTTMTDIVGEARRLAQSGDVVLLSTACASFDMFKDYKDRGAQFKAAVSALD